MAVTFKRRRVALSTALRLGSTAEETAEANKRLLAFASEVVDEARWALTFATTPDAIAKRSG